VGRWGGGESICNFSIVTSIKKYESIHLSL
jgi:hypothetical protein